MSVAECVCVVECGVNMASVRSLTDEELRDKLKEHGILSPVTASTRTILIKKLNHAMAGAKKAAHQQARARRSVTSVTSVTGGGRLHTFSSDEDDDETENHLRSSSSRTSRSSRASRVSRDGGASQPRHYDRRNGTSGTARGARASRGSGGRGESVAAASQPGGRDGNTTTSTTTDSRDRYRLFFPSLSGRSGLGLQVRSSEDYDTGSDSDLADLAEDSVDSGGGGGDGGGGRVLWAGGAEAPQQAESTPTRLQNHMSPGWSRAARPKAHLENGREWAEGEARGGPTLADCVVSQAEPSRVANGRHHSEGGAECQAAEESTWHYKVPLLLLVLLAVFFGVVATLYVNMRMPLLPTLRSVPALVSRALASLSLPVPFFTPHTAQWSRPNALPQPALPPAAPPLPPHHTSSQHTENKFPVCSNTLKSNCLTVQAMAQVQPLLGQLEEVVLPALHHQAGLYQCGDAAARHLSIAALQDLLHHTSVSLRSSGVGVDMLESLGRLVEWNPHWGLEAVRGEADGVLLGLALSAQPTHILCHITTAIYSFFYLIMGLVTVFITAWLAFSCVRYYRWKAEEEKQQVYELVEQILEVLGGLGGASGKDFVAVNHVRDSLISPRDRRTKQALWDRAVHFINCNESRVRREIQAVGGEDCEVWRWASGLPHHPNHSPGVDGGDGVGRPPPKVWQGPAFNTLSPHNVPNVSPTSCLKIRNMFDCDVEFGDSWPARIQDSILEKCEGISIVHVAVDRGSREGCVYLKCASLPDSGRAFRALHGWWYDGNLVTVKFLRDERYYQRFPSARHATRRLRPSNNKRLSLQVPAGQPEPPSHT